MNWLRGRVHLMIHQLQRRSVRRRFYKPRLEWLEKRLPPAADATAPFVTATPLSGNGQVLTGSLSSGPVNDYSVSVTGDTLLIATVIPEASPGFVPRLSLYDATGQLLIQSDQRRADRTAGATVQQHLQPGTYYLEVSAAPSSSSSAAQQQYQLTTALPASLPAFAPLAVGYEPESVALADVNGDGYPDIITANYGDNTVSVLLGNGDGSFHTDPYSSPGLPAGTFAVGQGPSSVVVADINGDGRPDLVTANDGHPDYLGTAKYYGHTVSVLLGNGHGAFQPDPSSSPGLPVGTFDVGIEPKSVAVADVNGDGHPDIVTANYEDNTVSVLLGNGKGNFAPEPYSFAGGTAGTFAVGNNPQSVAVADVNGDGRPDIVTANYDDTVSVLLGDGHGNFAPTPYSSTGLTAGTFAVGSDPYSVAVADVNGDGHPDIVTANYGTASYGQNTVSVLLGNGQGNFTPDLYSSTGLSPGTFAVGSSPKSVTVADVNGDGHPDIVTANYGDNTVSVLLGNGQGAFQTAQSFTVGNGPQSVAVADVNGDGRPDIVTANYYDNTVSVLLGNGDGVFQTAPSLFAGGLSDSVAVADFNGDGHPDIVTASYHDSTVSVLLGNGDGTFQPALSFAVGNYPESVVVADVNGDGRPDIVTANGMYGDYGTVSVLLGNGDGTFQPDPFSSPGLPAGTFAVGIEPRSVAVADLGNGHLDIVTANEGDNTVSVLLGNGDGNFTPDRYSPAGTFAVGSNPQSVAVADVNGDGHSDIVTANVGDTANGYAGTVSVLLGNGTGNFTPDPYASPGLSGGTFAVGHGAQSTAGADVAVADVNGDGLPDIVTANHGDDTVSLLLGNGAGNFAPDPYSSPGLTGGTFAVGNNPASVAVADVNGDGQPDIVTANFGTNTVSVLLGNGKGNFARDPHSSTGLTPGSFAVGNGPISVVVADVNGDGQPDIVTANLGDNTVSVLLNQGDAQFQAPTGPSRIPSQDVPQLQDLTADGIADAVSLDQTTGQILFRQGTEDPKNPFNRYIVINQAYSATAFTVVQTKGMPEIAALDSADQEVFVCAWSTSAKQFQEIGAFATGPQPLRIASADLYNNGLGDVVVGNGLDNTLTIALQQFAAAAGPGILPRTFDTFSRSVGASPSSIAFADLNRDGLPDIVVSDQVSGDVSVLVNNASHSFTTQERYRAGQGPFDVNIGSNGTTLVSQLQTVSVTAAAITLGGTDLITLNAGADSFSLLRAAGAGSLIDPQVADTYPVGQGAIQVLAGDFLENGREDVAILTTRQNPSQPSQPGISQFLIFPNNGDGTFGEPIVSAAGEDATGFSFLPGAGGQPERFLVGDGYGDFLTLIPDANGRPGAFTIFRGKLDGEPLAVGTTASGQAFVVVADQSQDQIQVSFDAQPGVNQLNTIDSNAQTPTLLAPGAVQLVDLNQVPSQNPIQDLIVTSQLGNDVLVYPGLGNGSFGSPMSFAVGFEPKAFTVGDFTDDGGLDLAVANQGSNDISILLSTYDSNGIWNGFTYGPRLSSGGSEPIGVQAGDFTGRPGILDLSVTNAGGQIATMPGIGSNGTGTGFFKDNSPISFNVPGTPIGSITDGLLPTTQGIFRIDPSAGTATEVFASTDLTAISAAADGDVVAGFDGGSLALLIPTSTGSLAESLIFGGAGLTDPSGPGAGPLGSLRHQRRAGSRVRVRPDRGHCWP